ncbi:hypothetical protein RJT34_16601 [Clitoria ternatea]|uniref:Uncharacterized protein n=1 Tax=Clitoria ternatea TaxID=43366 RepID=A0AAN9J9H7_CLITE
MWLWIGTPPQRFALVVDTRGIVTYVPCFTCQQCGNHQILARMGMALLSEPVTEIIVITICFVMVCDGDMVNKLRFGTKAMIQIYKSLYRTHFLGFTGWPGHF